MYVRELSLTHTPLTRRLLVPQMVDYQYFVAFAIEYIRSLNFHHIPVQHFMYELVINALVRNRRFYQLHQFLQYHVVSDSIPVACQLLSLEQTYPPAQQLALDMLKRLNSSARIVEVLLSRKQVCERENAHTLRDGSNG